MKSAPVAPSGDLVRLDELAQRIGVSEKTLKRLHNEADFPLFRVSDRGALVAFWSEVEQWIRGHGKVTRRPPVK